MKNDQFYTLIDQEITQIITENKENENIKKHPENKPDQRKGYAFLIWFLKFYGQLPLFARYITDGSGDYACDIIFSKKDTQNQTTFYVVQSKWAKFLEKTQEVPQIDGEEFAKTISDFQLVLNGEKKDEKNQIFTEKYKELITHLENNGKVKFIFFTLASYNNSITETIENFNKIYSPNVSLEIIDFEKIKNDYIDFKFKKIITQNPLEPEYDAEYSQIILPIERTDETSNKKDFLAFEGKEQAYIFLLKPKTLHTLFQKYKFNLFFKNVRNPIHNSNFNAKMQETLLRKPNSFWYFNNGITAISKIIPPVGTHAKKIEITGLQIINGAQTVYSVYYAYENATSGQRKVMDSGARISLRLIKSADEDFNLEITRFTNSQNPMYDRDFVANHDIQKRLQMQSFKTNFWYEKRQDEFRTDKAELEKLNIGIVSNKDMLKSYISFHLQNPYLASFNEDYFFISRKDDENGLYEVIFNKNTRYEDILAGYLMDILMHNVFHKMKNESEWVTIIRSLFQTNISFYEVFISYSIAILNIIFQKYYSLKYSKNANPEKSLNVSKEILKYVTKNEKEKNIHFPQYIIKIGLYVAQIISNFFDKNGGTLNSNVPYELFKEELENTPFNVSDIDDMEDIIFENEL